MFRRIIKIYFMLLLGALLLITTIGMVWANRLTPVMIKDINPAGYSSPSSLIDMNGLLFFAANDGPMV